MKDLKPIPTTYNGVEYRSRLEARWAIYFDTLKISFEYELEGYQVTDKIRYLPDYFLPELSCFVEIKPTIEVMTAKDIEKLYKFATHEEGINLLLIVGAPGKHEIWLINRRSGCPFEEFNLDEFSSDKEFVSEFLVYCEKVKFQPLPLHNNPRIQIAYEVLNDFMEFTFMEAVRDSQYQFKDFKKKGNK
jgi:hypothetical protein